MWAAERRAVMAEERWGKTVGLAGAGFLVGGPLGAAIGCAVGAALDKIHENIDAKREQNARCVICGRPTYGTTHCPQHGSMMHAGKHHGH
jgi:hypothetical protein